MSKISRTMKRLRNMLFTLVMWTWCLPQTLIGLAVLARYSDSPRRNFHGAHLCCHSGRFGGLSMGKFIFANGSCSAEVQYSICLHEFGHCIQSLMLGPLFLPVIAIPSALWCNLQACKRYRASNNVDYHSFYTERWADELAHRFITKRSAVGESKQEVHS